MHILLAEDSQILATTAIYYLKKHGHRVTHVTNGLTAVSQFIADVPDLVLMDIEMPDMDGIEATRRIKSIQTKKWVPVMMLTGRISTDDVIRGLDAGADDYLFKPIEYRELVARINARQRIVDLQNKLFGILDNAHEGILTIDSIGLVQSFNLAAEKIFGYQQNEVIGCNVSMLMPEPYQSEHNGYLHNYITTHHAKVIGSGRKVAGKRKNGEIFPMHLAVSKLENPQGLQFIGIVRDISQEETDRQHIEHLALHDELTDLPNRAYFTQQITACIKSAIPFALLFIDLDGFKPINDNFGHKVGDQVLITIAHKLRGSLAGEDFVSRLGGDEFLVILKGISSTEDVKEVGSRILKKIGEPININGNSLKVGASIGAALCNSLGQSEDDILNAADDAMYKAKREGKNRIVMAS